MPLLTEAFPKGRDAAAAHRQDPVDGWVELDLPATFGGRPDLPYSAEIDSPTSVDLGEAEGLESIDELTELADVGEGLCMPRPHQGLAAFGLEKVDLLRVDGNAPPVLQMQQDAVFKDNHKSSLRLPVVSAVKRVLGRLNGRFGGWAANCMISHGCHVSLYDFVPPNVTM